MYTRFAWIFENPFVINSTESQDIINLKQIQRMGITFAGNRTKRVIVHHWNTHGQWSFPFSSVFTFQHAFSFNPIKWSPFILTPDKYPNVIQLLWSQKQSLHHIYHPNYEIFFGMFCIQSHFLVDANGFACARFFHYAHFWVRYWKISKKENFNWKKLEWKNNYTFRNCCMYSN